MIKHILAEDHQGNTTRLTKKDILEFLGLNREIKTSERLLHHKNAGLETINDKYDEIKRFNKLSHNSFTKSRKQRVKEYQTGFKKSLNTLSK